MALRLLRHELEVLKLESEMQDKTWEQIDRGQRDYYLREQMKVIRTELGEEDEEERKRGLTAPKSRHSIWTKRWRRSF